MPHRIAAHEYETEEKHEASHDNLCSSKEQKIAPAPTGWHPFVLESGNECAWEAFIDAIAHYAIQVLLNEGGEKD